MASETDCPIETKARNYYDSDDAETFYSTIWGGENIHIGLYNSQTEPIADASHRTVENLAQHLQPLTESHRVLDMGSGYGGTARHLAQTYGCGVTGLNLSEVENERARRLNKEQGLDSKVDIIKGTFEKVDLPDASFDVIYSQDSFLHSGDRGNVVAEAARLLKPGGIFVFTDIMQSDTCDLEKLKPILERIDLTNFGSPEFYRKAAKEHGLEEFKFVDQTNNLITHYGRVLAETKKHEDDLRKKISGGYLDRMKRGLELWVGAGEDGHLVWPTIGFRKPVASA